MLDTGFTGHLTLPSSIVDDLDLPVIGSAESMLADGSIVSEDVCIALVGWHGDRRPVRAVIADATPLLGMALLRGSELCMSIRAGGELTIEELD